MLVGQDTRVAAQQACAEAGFFLQEERLTYDGSTQYNILQEPTVVHVP